MFVHLTVCTEFSDLCESHLKFKLLNKSETLDQAKSCFDRLEVISTYVRSVLITMLAGKRLSIKDVRSQGVVSADKVKCERRTFGAKNFEFFGIYGVSARTRGSIFRDFVRRLLWTVNFELTGCFQLFTEFQLQLFLFSQKYYYASSLNKLYEDLICASALYIY